MVDHGASAEYRCAAELLARGVLPNWPSSNMYPYDMIADTGKNRYRIQVKSSRQVKDKIRTSFRMETGGGRQAYTREDADFIIFYSSHWDFWYVFPVGKIPTSITLDPMDKKNKWNKYLEAWDLLR